MKAAAPSPLRWVRRGQTTPRRSHHAEACHLDNEAPTVATEEGRLRSNSLSRVHCQASHSQRTGSCVSSFRNLGASAPCRSQGGFELECERTLPAIPSRPSRTRSSREHLPAFLVHSDACERPLPNFVLR